MDNENAAELLRTEIDQKDIEIEWVAVRPDSLINEDELTEYKDYPSPIRGAIYDTGTTSRINLAHFMTERLLTSTHGSNGKGKFQ